MEKPVFPELTRKIINFTYRYIPGVSPPSRLPEVKRRTIIHEQFEFEISPASLRVDKVEPDELAVPALPPPSNSLVGSKQVSKNVGITIRALICIVFTILVFICMYYDGYIPETNDGLPETISYTQAFWPGNALDMSTSLACGPNAAECHPFSTQDAWMGYKCPGDIFQRSNPDYIVVRGGGENMTYTADSYMCYAAVHAGIVDAVEGGCFEARYSGQGGFFSGGISSNGVTSSGFGWFPRGVQLRAPQSEKFCFETRWATELAICFGFIFLLVVWRIDATWFNYLSSQWGFYYAAMITFRQSGDFWGLINQLSDAEFTMVPMSIVLFYFFSRPGFCPDPKRFPLEALLFYCVPFWAFIHIDDYQYSFGANFSFDSSSFSKLSSGSLACLIAIAIVAPVLFILQVRDLYKAGLLPIYLFAGIILASYLLIVGNAADGLLSYHLHHYFIGLFFCLVGRGQHKHSIIIQGIGVGLFIQGLSVYGTAPFFDQEGNPDPGYIVGTDIYQPVIEQPIWTAAELDPTGTLVTLEWALPSALVQNWQCGRYVAYLIPAVNELLQRRLLLAPDPVDTNYNAADLNFYVARNGVLFPGLYSGSFQMNVTDNPMTLENPLIFTAAMPTYGPLSQPLPLPFPTLNGTVGGAYYTPGASLCDRLYGIYSKALFADTVATPNSTWWLYGN